MTVTWEDFATATRKSFAECGDDDPLRYVMRFEAHLRRGGELTESEINIRTDAVLRALWGEGPREDLKSLKGEPMSETIDRS